MEPCAEITAKNVFRHFCVLDLWPFSGPRDADDLFVVGTYVPNFKCLIALSVPETGQEGAHN